MIYFNGIYSVLEALYLEEELTEVLIEADIVVNPTNSSYLSGKTIILNQPGQDLSNIRRIQSNPSIKIISRIPEYPDIKTVPYLEKLLFNVMWNGREVDDKSNIEDAGIEVNWPKLYFPKIKNPGQVLFNDCPSALGYLLYQVGQDNLINFKLFNNLDVIKCKKR